MISTVDWNNFTVTDSNGITRPFHPHPFWMFCPTRTTWKEEDGPIPPLDFGLLLHNAKVGRGMVPPLAVILEGISLKIFKRNNAKKAEELLEKVRTEFYPTRPSRLRSYFLNSHKDIAERRMSEWPQKNHYKIVQCHLMPTTGTNHIARISKFESLATSNPDDISLAHSYWKERVEPIDNVNKHDIEILADCSLFFPDWESFSLLDSSSLVLYSKKLAELRNKSSGT